MIPARRVLLSHQRIRGEVYVDGEKDLPYTIPDKARIIGRNPNLRLGDHMLDTRVIPILKGTDPLII